MPEIVDLLAYTAQVRPPSLEELHRVSVRRRRRAAAVTSAVAATGLAIVLAIDPLSTRDAAPAPVAPNPTPNSRTAPTLAPGMVDPARFPPLTPEQIHGHPGAVFEPAGGPPQAAPGGGARRWTACRVACTPETPNRSDEIQSALEVTRDDFRTGSLYPLETFTQVSHVENDWYLLSSLGAAVMVNSRKQTRVLTTGSPVTMTEIAGPLAYAGGLVYVDVKGRELHHVEAANGSTWDWYGSGNSWYWGIVSLTDDGRPTSQGIVWRNQDGTYEVAEMPIVFPPVMLRSGIMGTVAVADPEGPPLVLVSTDYGATWQRRLVPDGVATGETLPANWATWPPA